MDDAYRIWNRACDPDYAPTKRGDSALHAILSFHSLSMNGGIVDPLETDFALATRASDGYRLFGAEELAQLVVAARAIAEPVVDDDGNFDSLNLSEGDQDALEALNDRLPDDSDVEVVFRRYLAEHPDEFDAL